MSHLYVVAIQEDAVVHEAGGPLPAALQSAQVEEMNGAVLQADSNPLTAVIS